MDDAHWVYLLLAFTCQENECQDLLSPCNGMHVCTDQTSAYTLIHEYFREWSLTKPMLTLREKSPLPEAERRIKPAMLHPAGQRAQCTTK